MSNDRRTPDEYLKAERIAEARSEYVAGHVVAMAGTSFRHAELVANMQYSLIGQLKGKPCRAVSSEVKVRVQDDAFFYPDILVTCGEAQFHDKDRDVLLNPKVIVEVLSKSTEKWDRGGKFDIYRKIPSLTDYLLVSQDRCVVEHRIRQVGDVWMLENYHGAAAVVSIESIGCTLPLADIYNAVDGSTSGV